MGKEEAIRGYKKQIKAQKRRIQIEKDNNKRLVLLLTNCAQNLPKGLLQELVQHELHMQKYKYH